MGIVKLMGRQSGYITMYATIASGQVDIVLIPEVHSVICNALLFSFWTLKSTHLNFMLEVPLPLLVCEHSGLELIHSCRDSQEEIFHWKRTAEPNFWLWIILIWSIHFFSRLNFVPCRFYFWWIVGKKSPGVLIAEVDW